MKTIPVHNNKIFNLSNIRPAQFAGYSYPSEERSLRSMLDKVIDKPHTTLFTGTPVKQGATAIIAPHIDFRVGLSVYGPAYYALQDSSADVFVVFATSHYAWGNLFIPTFQHFSTPIGTVQTDHELLHTLYERMPTLAKDDNAHKEEHSIEFETIFLQHLFGNRTFTILPILVTSFYPFIQHRRMPKEVSIFQQFCTTLREVLRESGKKVAFVASADMAHIGRKFDDPFDAAPMLDTIKQEDMYLLQALEHSDASAYYRRIADRNDAYKICGLPPIYSMLETVQCSDGTVLGYEQWNEVETRSAVTYSSIAYYKSSLL